MNIKDFHSWAHSKTMISEKAKNASKDMVGKYHPGGEVGYQGTQAALSAAGQIPVAGIAADLGAAAHSVASGRLGDVSGVAKLAKTGTQLPKAASKTAKTDKIAAKAKSTISGKN